MGNGTGRKRNALLSAGIVCVLMAVVLRTTGICFETNDDKCITEILSGAIALSPDAHAVYVNYLLTLPLSWLYSLTTQIPWYGGLLILLQGIAYGCILDSLYDCCGKGREYVLSTVTGIGLFFMNYYLIGQIQYTSTAALLAVAGYVCMLLWGKNGKGIAVFALLEGISFLLRSQAMLMIQPLGLTVYLGLLLGNGEIERRKKISCLTKVIAVLCAVCLTGAIGNAVGYHGDGWREYNRANEARTIMFDYYGAPDYNEAKPILDQYGVTEAQYTAYLNYVMIYGEVTPACAEELADYSMEHRQTAPGMIQMIKTMGRYCLLENCYGLNHMVMALWAVALLALLWERRSSFLWPLAGLGVGRVAVWGYLIVKGRLPLRLTLPLFGCEAVLLWVLLLIYRNQNLPKENESRELEENPVLQKKVGKQKGGAAQGRFGCIITVIFCILCCYTGIRQFCYVKQENQRQEAAMEEYRAILAYCDSQAGNSYLLDAISFCDYKGNALETDLYCQHNSLVTGNWYSGSPVMVQYTKAYLQKGEEGICLIVNDDGRGTEHPAVSYLAEKTGTEPQLVQNQEMPSGGHYLIWYFY